MPSSEACAERRRACMHGEFVPEQQFFQSVRGAGSREGDNVVGR